MDKGGGIDRAGTYLREIDSVYDAEISDGLNRDHCIIVHIVL